jgi:hypothetical protein
MDPGCAPSRRRTHVAARCYRCTTRVATIFLQNVQKPPEKVYRRARIRCATRRPCHCSELVTFWFFTKSDAENRQLTCQKNAEIQKITNSQENFVCAADRLVRTLLVDRPPGSTRRARADVAVWVPGGAFTSKQCALLGAHEKSRSTWLRLPIKTLGEGSI